ncbi:MAG: SpoIIE family protein phosphatase [Anaerolineales bacterium]|nr:SpoIIE family protein phosphatase [Anaerolineales bacterium]
MINESIQALLGLSFLQGADPDVVIRLAETAIVRTFQPGQVILKEGDRGREVLLVIDGQVEVVKGRDKDEILLSQRGKGEMFGEMGFIEDQPRFATIRALETTRLLEFSEESMRAALAQQPELLFRTTQILSSRLRQAQGQMIEDLQRKNQELAQAYHELQAAQSALLIKERMERDLQLARELQQSILPHRFPKLPKVSFAARSQPARQVGGDFYDVIPLKGGRIGLVMADVSDKGLPAAIFMALSRSLIRAEARRSTSPKNVLLQTHKLLREISQEGIESSATAMFITIVYGVLDPVQGAFCYARAGHNHPLLYRSADHECRLLKVPGTLLGFTDRVTLEEDRVDLQPGDMLLLYTDGITDANSPEGEFFDMERLCQAVYDSGARSAQELCDFVFKRVEGFQATAEQYDDMALLVVSLDAASRNPGRRTQEIPDDD